MAAAAEAASAAGTGIRRLIISPHSARRLYFAGDRLYRSDNRGDSWTRGERRTSRASSIATKIPIMGKVWPADSVAYKQATTTLSTITALDESPLLEGLIYVGTDDGIVQVTEDGGNELAQGRARSPACRSTPTSPTCTRRRAMSNTVFVTLNNYLRGDFKPYVMKSADRGRTWTSISGDLPERSGAWSIVQDTVNPNLLFAGLEFGVLLHVRRRRALGAAEGRPAGFTGARPRSSSAERTISSSAPSAAGRSSSTTTRRSATSTPQALADEARLFPLRDAYLFDVLNQVEAAWGDTGDAEPAVRRAVHVPRRSGGGGRRKARADNRGRYG